MKTNGKKIITTLSVLIISSALLFAGAANKEFNTFKSDLEHGKVTEAMNSYDRFLVSREKDMDSLYKQLDKAMKKNNGKLYNETVMDIRELRDLGMTREDSDALLSLIVEGEGEMDYDAAAWLYDHSPYYQPVIGFDYSLEKPGLRSRGTRSFTMRPGTEITLPTGEDIGVRTSDFGVLKGWGLMPGMVTYRPGETIKMPLTSQTLYAVWENGVAFKDTVTGTDDYFSEVEKGDTIQLPDMADVSGNKIFAGWWDPSTGEYIPKDETEYEVTGSGASFEALWLGLEVKDAQTSPYKTIPSGTQVALTFDVENTGNEDLKDLEVKVTSPNKDVHFMNDEFYFRQIGEGRTGRISTGILYSGAKKGEELPVAVEIKDGEGNTWNGGFTLKSK